MTYDKYTLYQNITAKQAKERILEYQRTSDKSIIYPLFLLYNHLIFKTCSLLRAEHPWLRDVPMEDVYHTAIAGFQEAIDNFKPKYRANVLGRYFKVRMQRQIKVVYGHRRKCLDMCRVDPNKKNSTVIFTPRARKCDDERVYPTNCVKDDLETILKSHLLTEYERTVITLYSQGEKGKDIARKMRKTTSEISLRIKEVIEKLRDFYGK